ncbi:uncharacterized protein [Bemisia tabaci]|uniref:uncharacterized protein n=1 Tax=Bemisia tabaci TaxID=7038 RepID=UPI003B28612C
MAIPVKLSDHVVEYHDIFDSHDLPHSFVANPIVPKNSYSHLLQKSIFVALSIPWPKELPNIDGPTFLKRRLIIHAILSILWYGIEIWATSCNRKKNTNLITTTIRPLKRSLSSAYKTVSNSVLNVITDLPPTDLLIEKRLRTIKKSEDKVEIEIDINRRWNQRWMEEGMENKDKWLHKLLPSLQPWIERSHGDADFYLSQFFSGHGSFNSYLYRFKLAPSPLCPLCLSAPDTPEHTFFGCTHIEGKKKELETKLDTDISPTNIMSLMLNSTENWELIKTYITKIIKTKIATNNSLNSQSTPTLSVAAGEKSPNRDDSGIIRADTQP